MHVFNEETLIRILADLEGVPLSSYGRPRDAFELPVDVPHWVSGFGGNYEMRHTNVPRGVFVAVGNLEALNLADDAALRLCLETIDIYPTGHSGDFTGTDLTTLRKWFTDRSRRDDAVNKQTPILHARQLTPKGLGEDRYEALAEHLVNRMRIFLDPDAPSVHVPVDCEQRRAIVHALLDGLSRTLRYTRIDAQNFVAYQVRGELQIIKASEADIALHLAERHKILVVRQHSNGLSDITPLDMAMIGQTYITADGAPLGDRGVVDLSMIVTRAAEIEQWDVAAVPLPYLRPRVPIKTS
jgi:hypothetical protein